MATIENKDRMAWFKMDAGAFMADTAGFTNNEVGIYAKLVMLYWTSGNQLPSLLSVIKRKIGVSDEDESKLNAILDEFFSPDEDGEYRHEQLDNQLDLVKARSKMQSDKAKKRFEPPPTSNEEDIEF